MLHWFPFLRLNDLLKVRLVSLTAVLKQISLTRRKILNIHNTSKLFLSYPTSKIVFKLYIRI